MSNSRKTYFLCPTWDYHPDGPIQLGNIILSPSCPAEALNSPSGPRPSEDALFPTTTKTGVTWSTDKLRSGRYGLWTQFLSSLTGVDINLGYEHSFEAGQAFAFKTIDTIEFLPTPDFLQRSIASSPMAIDFLRRSRFRKYVYMITALKIARGTTVKTSFHTSRAPELKVGIDGALIGAPVSLGPEFRGQWGDGESNSFDGSSDFVFAFRLRKVIVHRSGKITHSEYTKGAMYDADRRRSDLQGPLFQVDGLAGEDASAEDFGCDLVVNVMDDDEECVCVRPEEED